MAVVSVTELPQQRGLQLGALWRRRYRRSFQVLCDVRDQDPTVVLNADGLPRMYDAYVSLDGSILDARALVADLEPEQDSENPYRWIVRAEYQSVTLDPALLREAAGKKFNQPGGVQPDDVNPLQKIPEVRWSFVSFTRPLVVDLVTGEVPVNSAGEPFDPPIEVDDSRLVLSYKRNVATINPSQYILYKDAVNTDLVLGVSPGQVKLADISATRRTEPFIYFEESLTLHFRSVYEQSVILMAGFDVNWEPWQPTVLDQGYYELQSDGTKKLIRDTQGQPLSSPSLLNGYGKQLLTQPITAASNTSPITITVPGNASNFVLGGPVVVVSWVGGNSAANGLWWASQNLNDVANSLDLYQVVYDQNNNPSKGPPSDGTQSGLYRAGTGVCKIQPKFLRFRAYKKLPFAPLNIV